MQPFRIDDFKGGIADSFLSARPGSHTWFENYHLDETGKPYVREGMEVLSNRIPVSGSSTRLSSIYIDSIPFNYPLVTRADRLYRVNPSNTPVEIQGPSGNPSFPGKLHTDFEAGVMWQRQLIAAGPNMRPARVVNTSGDDTFTAYELGLPKFSANPTVSSAGGTGNTYLYGFHWLWVFQSGDATLYEEVGPPVYVQLTNVGAPNVNNVTISALPTITNGLTFNYDTGTLVVNSIGTTNGSAVLTGFGSTANVLVGMAVTGTGIPAGSRILSKTASTVTLDRNATATGTVTVTFYRLLIRVFRTAANGASLYELASVPNGTTSYTDNRADAAITSNEVIYTDGDVQPWEAPPADAKYVVEVNDYFWFAGDRYLQQSVQGAPGGCPSAFRQIQGKKVMGLSSTDTFPILFTSTNVYRVEGNFDEFGDGGFELKDIDDNPGCLSNRAIVKTPQGIVWPGIGAFWWTDGYSAKRISLGIPQRYKNYANGLMVGVYNADKNTVEWTASTAPNNTTAANDIIITLYLDFGISEFSTFTVHTAANNIYPTTVAFSGDADVPEQYRSRLLIGEARGYLLWRNPLVYTDPYIDTTKFPSVFTKKVIRYRWESQGFALGEDSMRSYTVQLSAEIDSATEVSAQFYTRRDATGAWNKTSEFRQDGAIVWGISEYTWNDPSVDGQAWNDVRLVDGLRYVKAQTLRGARWQVAMTNSLTWITNSDAKGTATIALASPYISVTLDNVANSWPSDCEDYELCFDDDDYTTGYTIIERTSNTVVKVIDPYGQLAQWLNPNKKWQMRGYRKGERVKLQNVTLWVTDKEQSQKPGRAAEGTNA